MTPTYSSQADDFLLKQPTTKSDIIKKAINNLPAGELRSLKVSRMVIGYA